MVKIVLSLWDLAGQERFADMRKDFFKGTAAVGLIFDLARPETFEKIDLYLEEIRERAGNIPIILAGNKDDLKEDVGEAVQRDTIIQKVNQYNLIEYFETSALKNHNVDKLFNQLSIAALLDLQPRKGEIISESEFTFKVLLAGEAAVGKSSLIRTFVNKEFEPDYKITIGLDFKTCVFEIPNDDLPKEVVENIKKAIKEAKIPRIKRASKKKKKLEEMEESDSLMKAPNKLFSNKVNLIIISVLGIALIIGLLLHLSFFL